MLKAPPLGELFLYYCSKITFLRFSLCDFHRYEKKNFHFFLKKFIFMERLFDVGETKS